MYIYNIIYIYIIYIIYIYMLHCSIFVSEKNRDNQKSQPFRFLQTKKTPFHSLPNPPGHQLQCPTHRAPWVPTRWWMTFLSGRRGQHFFRLGEMSNQKTFKFCDWNTGRRGGLDQIGIFFPVIPPKNVFAINLNAFGGICYTVYVAMLSTWFHVFWNGRLLSYIFRQKSLEIWSLFCEVHMNMLVWPGE